MEKIPFETEFQLLDNVVITEKQQEWKRKFISMDLMRLIRRALDKLKENDIYWNEYKCFERSYGLTILSDNERKHLSLYPIAISPCHSNCILFHQKTGLFQDWFSFERLIQLSEYIKYEIEFFLHKKIPTVIKYPIRSIKTIHKPIIRVLQEQEDYEPVLPYVINKKIEIDMDMDMDMKEWTDEM